MLAAVATLCLVVEHGARTSLPGDQPAPGPASPPSVLEPRAFTPLPIGAVTPKGWLLRQLVLQAEGLGGHLAQFWPDVMDSVWVGGSADGGLHERTPYWLNGIVPLAFLLRNAGITHLGPFAGIWKAPSGKKGWPPGPLCEPGADAAGADLAGPGGYLVSTQEKCRDDCARADGCRWFVIDACHVPAGVPTDEPTDGTGLDHWNHTADTVSGAGGGPTVNNVELLNLASAGGAAAAVNSVDGLNLASERSSRAAAALGTRCWLKGAGARPGVGGEKIPPGGQPEGKIPPGAYAGGEKIPPGRGHPAEKTPQGVQSDQKLPAGEQPPLPKIPAVRGGCRCVGKVPVPFEPVDVMAQATQYINFILGHQAPSGWLGPDDPTSRADGTQYWPPSNVLLALASFAEGSAEAGDLKQAEQATSAILSHVLEMRSRLGSVPLKSWAQQRWMDLAWVVEWLLDRSPAHPAVTKNTPELLHTLALLHAQGYDREAYFEQPGPLGASGNSHNVNVAQGLKSTAVLFRFNASYTFDGRTPRELALRRMDRLDREVGLPTGMYNGDEFLPSPPTRSPSRGIELCGVAEAIWSYACLFAAHGDASFAERAERIAFNALPATWASPTGGDMWAHQYLQAVNEISAVKSNPHLWQRDGPYAETYGLEPNYGCCTANFQQGWPKFASHLFFTSPTGAVVVAAWAPASATIRLPTKTQPPPAQRARRQAPAGPEIDGAAPAAPEIDGEAPAGRAAGGGPEASPEIDRARPAAPEIDGGREAASDAGGGGGEAGASIQIEVETDYPFGDTAMVIVTVPAGGWGAAGGRAAGNSQEWRSGGAQARGSDLAGGGVPIMLRIPSWADAATVNGEATVAGTFWHGIAPAGTTTTFSVYFRPSVRLETWDAGSISVHRGPLLFALPLTPSYTTTAHHFGTPTMSNDYEIRTSDPWAYALDADPSFLPESLVPSIYGYVPGAAPFNHSGWPITIRARLRPLYTWKPDARYNESAAPPPKSPACAAATGSATAAETAAGAAAAGASPPPLAAAARSPPADRPPPFHASPRAGGPASPDVPGGTEPGTSRVSTGDCGPPELHDLVPYGGTELRVGEMPLAFHVPVAQRAAAD